jgi:hypothetical protein
MDERHALSVADKLSFKRICFSHICYVRHSLTLLTWFRYLSTRLRVDSCSRWARWDQLWFHITSI